MSRRKSVHGPPPPPSKILFFPSARFCEIEFELEQAQDLSFFELRDIRIHIKEQLINPVLIITMESDSAPFQRFSLDLVSTPPGADTLQCLETANQDALRFDVHQSFLSSAFFQSQRVDRVRAHFHFILADKHEGTVSRFAYSRKASSSGLLGLKNKIRIKFALRVFRVGSRLLQVMLEDAFYRQDLFEHHRKMQITFDQETNYLEIHQVLSMWLTFGIVFSRERKPRDHWHSSFWPYHPLSYCGPMPYPYLEKEEAASILRAVKRSFKDLDDCPGIGFPLYQKALQLAGKRLGVKIRVNGMSKFNLQQNYLRLLRPLAVNPDFEKDTVDITDVAPDKKTFKNEAEKLMSLFMIEADHLPELRDEFLLRGNDLEFEDMVDVFNEKFGGNVSRESMSLLFRNIDSNSSGSISWEEFIDTILRVASSAYLGEEASRQTAETMFESLVVSKGGGGGGGSRKVPLQDVVYVSGRDNFIAVNRDGFLTNFKCRTGIVNSSYRLWRLSSLGRENDFLGGAGGGSGAGGAGLMSKMEPCQVLCMCEIEIHASEVSTFPAMLAISTNDGWIRLFDSGANSQLGAVFFSSDTQVLCVHSFVPHKCHSYSLVSFLALGDVRGHVTVLSIPAVMQQVSKLGYVRISPEMVVGKHAIASSFGDDNEGQDRDVVSMRYVDETRSLVVGLHSGDLALIDMETQEARLFRSLHSKSINAIEYVENFKYLATAGTDRVIKTWEPWSGKNVGNLRGHLCSITSLLFLRNREILLSLDINSVVKWWSTSGNQLLGSYSCLLEPLLSNRTKVTHLIAARRAGRNDYVIFGGKSLFVWKLKFLEQSAKKEITLAGQEHKNPILSALFSQTFSQIITVDNSGLVCSWDVSSGKQITWFHARTKSGTEEEAGRKDGGEERNGRSQGKDSAQGGRGGMRKEESWKKARATSSDKPPPPLSSKNLMQHNRQQEGGEGSSNVKDKESVNPSSSSSAYTRVTAASLDLVQCRLILGWNGGGIFIYNFSSGTLLQKLVSDAWTDINSLAIAKQSTKSSKSSTEQEEAEGVIAAAEESGVIWLFPNRAPKNEFVVRYLKKLTRTSGVMPDIYRMCANNHILSCGASDGSVEVWNLASGRMIASSPPKPFFLTITGQTSVEAMHFFRRPISLGPSYSKGFLYASAGVDGTVRVCSSVDGKEMAEVVVFLDERRENLISCLAGDSSDSLLVVGDALGHVYVYNVRTLLRNIARTKVEAFKPRKFSFKRTASIVSTSSSSRLFNTSMLFKRASKNLELEATDEKLIYKWQADSSAVTSICCIEHSKSGNRTEGGKGCLLLLGFASSAVSFWSPTGQLLGQLLASESSPWMPAKMNNELMKSAAVLEIPEWGAQFDHSSPVLERRTIVLEVNSLSIPVLHDPYALPSSQASSSQYHLGLFLDRKQTPEMESSKCSREAMGWDDAFKVPILLENRLLTVVVYETRAEEGGEPIGVIMIPLCMLSPGKEHRGVLRLDSPSNWRELRNIKREWSELEARGQEEGQVPTCRLRISLIKTSNEHLAERSVEQRRIKHSAALRLTSWWTNLKLGMQSHANQRRLQTKVDEELFLKNPDGSLCEFGSKLVLNRVLSHKGEWWPPPSKEARVNYWLDLHKEDLGSILDKQTIWDRPLPGWASRVSYEHIAQSTGEEARQPRRPSTARPDYSRGASMKSLDTSTGTGAGAGAGVGAGGRIQSARRLIPRAAFPTQSPRIQVISQTSSKLVSSNSNSNSNSRALDSVDAEFTPRKQILPGSLLALQAEKARQLSWRTNKKSEEASEQEQQGKPSSFSSPSSSYNLETAALIEPPNKNDKYRRFSGLPVQPLPQNYGMTFERRKEVAQQDFSTKSAVPTSQEMKLPSEGAR